MHIYVCSLNYEPTCIRKIINLEGQHEHIYIMHIKYIYHTVINNYN